MEETIEQAINEYYKAERALANSAIGPLPPFGVIKGLCTKYQKAATKMVRLGLLPKIKKKYSRLTFG